MKIEVAQPVEQEQMQHESSTFLGMYNIGHWGPVWFRNNSKLISQNSFLITRIFNSYLIFVILFFS